MEVFNHTGEFPNGHHAEGRIAVLSDIHGQSDLFRHALAAIERPEETRLILLGDYIDRGPDTLGCLHLLNDVLDANLFKDIVMLPGNHEGMLSGALNGGIRELILWSQNGGASVIEEVDGDLGILRRLLPKQVWDRMSGTLPAFYETGSLLMVHAGLNPDVDAEAFLAQPYQTPRTQSESAGSWAWVRDACLKHEQAFKGRDGEDRFLIHGHSSCDMTESHETALQWVLPQTDNRMCLDLSRAGRLPLLQAEDNQFKIRMFGHEPYLGYFL